MAGWLARFLPSSNVAGQNDIPIVGISGCRVCRRLLIVISAAAAVAGPRLPSVSELETEGVCLLTQREDAIASMQQQHRFLLTSAPSLLIKDVPELLRLYKELVLQHTVLTLAVTHHHDHHHDTSSSSSHAPQLDLPKLSMPLGQSDHATFSGAASPAASPAGSAQQGQGQPQQMSSTAAIPQGDGKGIGGTSATQPRPSSGSRPASSHNQQLPGSTKQQPPSPLGRAVTQPYDKANSRALETGISSSSGLPPSNKMSSSTSSGPPESDKSSSSADKPSNASTPTAQGLNPSATAEAAVQGGSSEQQAAVSISDALEQLQPLQPLELQANAAAAAPASGLEDLAASAQPMSFAEPTGRHDTTHADATAASILASGVDSLSATTLAADAEFVPDHGTHKSGRIQDAAASSAAPAEDLLSNLTHDDMPPLAEQASHEEGGASLRRLPLSQAQGQAVLHSASPKSQRKGINADDGPSSLMATHESSKGAEESPDDMFSGLSMANLDVSSQPSGSPKAQ